MSDPLAVAFAELLPQFPILLIVSAVAVFVWRESNKNNQQQREYQDRRDELQRAHNDKHDRELREFLGKRDDELRAFLQEERAYRIQQAQRYSESIARLAEAVVAHDTRFKAVSEVMLKIARRQLGTGPLSDCGADDLDCK